MHAVDFYRLDSQASAKTAFLDALKADTCVPDNYANNSKHNTHSTSLKCTRKLTGVDEIEDFAQIGVVALFGYVVITARLY